MFLEITDKVNETILTIRTQDIKKLKKDNLNTLDGDPEYIYSIEFYNDPQNILISKEDYEKLNDILLSCYKRFKDNIEYLEKEGII